MLVQLKEELRATSPGSRTQELALLSAALGPLHLNRNAQIGSQRIIQYWGRRAPFSVYLALNCSSALQPTRRA
jgi:hypothetical protein